MGTGVLFFAQSLSKSPPIAEPPMPAIMMLHGFGVAYFYAVGYFGGFLVVALHVDAKI